MGNTSLDTFIAKVRASRRLGFGDLRRLQRDVLPNGLSDRSQAEALIALDGVLEKADDGWRRYLADALRKFVVAEAALHGAGEAELGEWLLETLAPLPPKFAASIMREMAQEELHVAAVLQELVGGRRKRGTRICAAAACRRAPDPRISSLPTPANDQSAPSIVAEDRLLISRENSCS
jgi:hypothetical protein